MTGLLLVNMGGPSSEEETRTFLKRMFLDPNILLLPGFLRSIFAHRISSRRYRNSWKKYLSIGGSPFITSNEQIARKIGTVLGHGYQIRLAFSYSGIGVKKTIEDMINAGIQDILVFPLYPHYSVCTTGSVIREVAEAQRKFSGHKFRVIKEFYFNEDFVRFWTKNIENHINNQNLKKPHLIFSAHSIPEKYVKKGDTYMKSIFDSARLIASEMNLSYNVCFQSRMGKVKWVGPDTLKFLAFFENKELDIVLIPISFVNENLETLYDIDEDMLPFAKVNFGFMSISRVAIPAGDENLVKALVGEISLCERDR